MIHPTMPLDDALHRVSLYAILEEETAILGERYKEAVAPVWQQPPTKFNKKESYGKGQQTYAIDNPNQLKKLTTMKQNSAPTIKREGTQLRSVDF